jgi:uncharacterized secreted protein with C-terminal beta-propeller domain
MLDAAGIAPAALPTRFESTEALVGFLREDALQRYGSLFDQPTYSGYPIYYLDAMAGVVRANGEGNADHSTTNTQVAGVDEGDSVEIDGEFLYLLGEHDVTIVDARPASQMAVRSRVSIDGYAFAEFLVADRLAVLSTINDYSSSSNNSILSIRGPWFISNNDVQLTLIDVSDRAAPTVVSETRFDGNFQDARAVGDSLYVVTTDNFGLPTPNTICTDRDPQDPKPTPTDPNAPIIGPAIAVDRFWYPNQDCVYESRESYLARITGHELELGIPQAVSVSGAGLPSTSNSPIDQVDIPANVVLWTDGQAAGGSAGSGDEFSDVATTSTALAWRPLNAATDIYRPQNADDTNLLSITTFDLSSSVPGPAASTAIAGAYSTQIYASTNSIYLVNPQYGALLGGGDASAILKFDLDIAGVDLVARGVVRGTTLNQFSIDEHNGYLRIATTSWSGDRVNNIYVLAQSGSELSVVGKLEDVARGEQLFSARFLGDRGFIVTFRRIDPLFALDLSDPTNPKVVGELHIPGFSNYLQAADDSHLIGIGRNATATGLAQELQVSLFNVGDLSNPQLTDRYSFDPNGWQWSNATSDPQAVGFYEGYDVLAIPVTATAPRLFDRDGDGVAESFGSETKSSLYVFKLNLNPTFAPVDPIELLGTIEHDTEISRSVRIGDVLYAISSSTVSAHPILHPDQSLGTLYYGQLPIGVPLDVPLNNPIVTQASQTPDATPPVVVSAVAAGSTWAPARIDQLETAATDASSTSTTTTSRAATNLTSANANQIKLTFSENVAVSQNDLSLAAGDGATYAIAGFAFDAAAHTGVWTLDRPLGAGEFTVTLTDMVTDTAGIHLDGNRDAAAGGAYSFTFRSLPGDVNQDGIVDGGDVRTAMRSSLTASAASADRLSADINGDGVVTYRDVIAIRNQLGMALPAPVQSPAAIIVTTSLAARRRSRPAQPTPTTATTPAPPEATSQAGVELRIASRRPRPNASAVDAIMQSEPSTTTPSADARTARTRRG